jgi:PhnB protein
MSSVNPIPDRYRRITPALIVREGVKALEFYAEVFQATERTRFPGPGGTIAHAARRVGAPADGYGDVPIMRSDDEHQPDSSAGTRSSRRSES